MSESNGSELPWQRPRNGQGEGGLCIMHDAWLLEGEA